jgi:transposase
MLDVLRVRLYPNKEQQVALAKNFGCCRFVWNYYLNKTNTQYQETKKGLSYCDMAKDLTEYQGRRSEDTVNKYGRAYRNPSLWRNCKTR